MVQIHFGNWLKETQTTVVGRNDLIAINLQSAKPIEATISSSFVDIHGGITVVEQHSL